jgi:hypothetical protein
MYVAILPDIRGVKLHGIFKPAPSSRQYPEMVLKTCQVVEQERWVSTILPIQQSGKLASSGQ